MGKKTLKFFGHVSPLFLSYIRDTDKNNLNKFRRLFREFIVLHPALYFMSGYNALVFTSIFTLLFIALYSIYELGYLYNDFVRIKYDEKPTIRPYINMINAKLAASLRVLYVVVIGIFVGPFVLSYMLAISILLTAIINHNLIRRKVDKIASRPFLRISKYMFIPISISKFNLEIISSCLLILLPFIVMDSEDTILFIIRQCKDIKPFPTKPYYVWLLTFMPLQFLLLLRYSPLLFIGEFMFIAASLVRHG